MVITYVYPDTTDEQYQVFWRCLTLAWAIRRTGQHNAHLVTLEDFLHNTPAADSACGHSDVIVVLRNAPEYVLERMSYWQQRGKRVVFDLDRPLPEESSFHTSGKDPQPSTGRTGPLSWGTRLADAVTVPTRRLLSGCTSQVPVHYIPDWLDVRCYAGHHSEQKGQVRIGLGGERVTYAELADSGLLTALQILCANLPQVQVHICNPDDGAAAALDLPSSQLVMNRFVPAQEWPAHLAQLDVGLAPVVGDDARRLSWRRPLEYMILQIPWVGSDQLAYRDLRRYGWLVPNRTDAWVYVLMEMVQHYEDYRLEAGREPYLFALGQDVDENVDQALQVYETIRIS